MTRTLKLLAALIIPTVLAWLWIGFVYWDWNPVTWSEGMRVTLAFLSFTQTVAAFIIFGDKT